MTYAQFETVHPFTDGNGRTGRALVMGMLRRAGLAARAPLPLPSGLLSNTEACFEALEDYRAGDVTQIIARFVEATETAIDNATVLCGDIRQIRESLLVTAARRASALSKLADVAVSEGTFTAVTVTDFT